MRWSGCIKKSKKDNLPFDFPRGTMKESRSIEIDFIIETTGKSEHGKTETKIHCGARQTAPEKPGTGPDACGAGDLVFGPHPHGAGFCAGQRGLEDSARRAVWRVWLRQLCGGRGAVLSGHPVHPRRGPAAPHCKAAAGAGVCQQHGHRVLGYPRRCPGGDHGSRLLPERCQRLAVRRRAGCRAGRQSAAALRAPGSQSGHGGAGPLRQPVHF